MTIIKLVGLVAFIHIFVPELGESHKTALKSKTMEALSGPDIIESPENITVVVGDDAYLPCVVKGNPKPMVIWDSRRVGRLQSIPGTKFQIDDKGISWKNVTKSNEDWYMCSARNSIDIVHSPWAYIKVLAKPETSEYPGELSLRMHLSELHKKFLLGLSKLFARMKRFPDKPQRQVENINRFFLKERDAF